IGGSGVAQGYLNNPELTVERFAKACGQWPVGSWQKEPLIQQEAQSEKTQSSGTATPNNQYPITGNTLYRTGDLARWQPDGNIAIQGRIDEQVKIRGFRIEIGEIETRMTNHPGINQATVLTRQSKNGDKYLCTYFVENPQQPTSGTRQPPVSLPTTGHLPPSPSIIRNYLAQNLPDYMIPAFFIKLEKIPLTPNGKIDKKALTEIKISRTEIQEDYIAPKSETEKALTQIWTEILDAEKALDVLVSRHESLRTVFKKVQDQPHQFITQTVKNPLETIELSTLEAARKKQTVENIYQETATKPFELSKPPLLRVRLVKKAAESYRLMFSLHHIITDGWSQEILKKEFIQIYNAIRAGREITLEPLNLQYKEIAIWNNKPLKEKEGNESFQYWKKKLTGGTPVVHLPADTVVEKEDRKGAACGSKIHKKLNQQLLKLAKNNQTTLFSVLLSAYLLLLSRLANQQEICCSVISSGREQYETHNIIGFFVNSLLFKIEIDENEPFEALLKRVAGHMTETLRHQAYPLEIVCERLKMKYPEIPVTINMLNIGEKAAAEKLPATGHKTDNRTSPGPDGEKIHVGNYPEVKFDLEPYFHENHGEIDIYWAYKKNMFRPLTIEHIIDRYTKYLDYFVKHPDHSLKDRQQKIEIPARRAIGGPGGPSRTGYIPPPCPSESLPNPAWRGRRRQYNGHILIDKFEDQVAKTPGNIAVNDLRKTCTYRDLNRTANRIARQILKTAAGQNVGLYFQHGTDMIAAILGTLKAGKTYVPLSVEYPEKRLAYMLSDSGAALLLTNNPNQPAARQLARTVHGLTLLNIDEIQTAAKPYQHHMEPGQENRWKTEGDINPHRETETETDKIAYILYTSGTTGRPKGVAQTHANVHYFIRNWIRKLYVTSADRMTLLASFCHDGSVPDIYSALHTGAALYPYNMKDRDLTVDLTQTLIEEKITIWHSVPSLFSYFSNTLSKNQTFPRLRLIILGGEAVRRHEVEMLKKHYPRATMANIYGQTESTVNSISLMDRYYNYEKCLIGEPLEGTQ
ncbi:MAG: AMP-binding protein, partial [bacterium]|nr:AMP-binding protein [bacterium]